MPSIALVALVGAIALLVLIPTRRLFIAGWSGRSLAIYFLGVVALGVIVAELRAPARFLIPILVIAYIAPFVTARDGVRRLFGRSAGHARPVVRPVEPARLPEPPTVVAPADREAAEARTVGSSGPAAGLDEAQPEPPEGEAAPVAKRDR